MTTPSFARALEPEVFVLSAWPLKPGLRLEDTSRFEDSTWQLGHAVHRLNVRSLTLCFDRVPQPFRATAKQLCLAILSGTLPPGEKRPCLDTVHTGFREAIRFLTWVDQRPEQRFRSLATLTGADLLDYQGVLRRTVRSVSGRSKARSAVRWFWRWRDHLTDRLAFDPRHVDGWGEPRGQRPQENRTQRIPEDVMGPLFVWALRFIDHFAADICAADAQWRRQRWGMPVDRTTRVSDVSTRAVLEATLDTYLTHNRPLPGWRGHPNLVRIARQTGYHRAMFRDPALRLLVESAAAVVGVAETAGFDLDVQGRLDGRPWIGQIVTSHFHDHGLAVLARMLQTAAYIVIAYLSGMRDSEVKALARGCLRTETDSTGRPYRWKVTSLSFKGEDDPRGVKAIWNVGEPVARAITVLEMLQPPGVDHLFNRLDHGPGGHKGRRHAAMTTGQTNDNLNHFAAWVNRYCDTHGRYDAIPAVNGRPFKLHTAQFRRTLAWFIARRPGGTIAGALQYRHHSIQVFEGYAGTSDSGFRAEVESEQALARGEHLLTVIDAHEHTYLAGPAAAEAARRLEEFGQRTRFQGTVVLDDRRLRRIMSRDDPAIYPGTYITCVHDPAKALCERARQGAFEGLGDHPQCQPMACRNVALTRENTDAWRGEIELVDQQLTRRRPPLPPLLQNRLLWRRHQIEDFLAALRQEPS